MANRAENRIIDLTPPLRPYIGGGIPADEVVVLERILPYLLNRTTFQLNQLLKSDLKPHGITIANWRVLAVLAANNDITMSDIASYAMIEPPTASRMVDRLVADGLIERRTGDSDRRVRSLALTPLGRETYGAVRDLAFAHTARALGGLSEAECAQLTDLLLRIEANLGAPLPDY
jgi:DNA-binding MarR family transcriptional regulator